MKMLPLVISCKEMLVGKISTFHYLAEVVNDLMGMNIKSDIITD
jgi:hypothetical protein